MAKVTAILGALIVGARSQSAPPCSPPAQIDHGLTDWDGKSGVARYACFQGYHLVGPPQIECRYGSWYSDTPVSLPACKPVVCNHPTLSHGHLETGESVRYRSGEEGTVVCDEGFELRSVSGKIVCTEDGSWQAADQGEFPICREKTCPYPDDSIPTISNGSIEINGNRHGGPSGGYKPGAAALYHCHSGFILVPLSAGKRVCRKGKWEGNMPACVTQEKSILPRTHCSAPLSISNGYYFTDRSSEAPLALPKLKVSEGQEQYERGTIARYHCKDGYALSSFHGQEIYRCMSNGEWSPKVPPVCISMETSNLDDPLEEVMCSSPPPIPYADFERVEGWLTSNGAVHGTVLEYSCRVGFRDSRTPCLPTRRTCHAGQWIGRKPSCMPFDFCERPPIISHGFMKSAPENVYHVLSEVVYECHIGYRMKGANSLKCHATGCWMPNDLPECIREDLYESSWSTSEETTVPLVAILISLSVCFGAVAVLTSVCLVVVCRRKGGAGPPPAGPAHWSTTVTVTPECRPRDPMGHHVANGHGNGSVSSSSVASSRSRQEQDRMALIAFADGVQQVTLPSYEEALRDNNSNRIISNGGNICDFSDQQQHHRHIISNGHATHPYNRGNNGYARTTTASTGSAAVASASRVHHPRRSRHPAGTGHNRSYVSLDQRSSRQHVPAVPNGVISGDANEILSDSASHHSVQVWPSCNNGTVAGGGVSNGVVVVRQHRRGGSTSGSSIITTGSNSSNSALGGGSATASNTSSNNSNSTSLRSSQSSNSAEATEGTTVQQQQQQHQGCSASLSSQTPSCKALAGSLASFDASNTVSTEGVPLLEENELETEGSNSPSVSGGDTGSATYSEGSSKT